MNYKKTLTYYYFPKEFNIDNLKKLIKYKNISIIFGFNNHSRNEFFETIAFCKKWRVNFYLINDFKMAIKYGAKGVFLNSDFKRQIFRGITFKNIEVIGSAHNQLEYFLKNRQEAVKLVCIHFGIEYIPVDLPDDFNAKENGYNHTNKPIKL